VDGDYHSFTFTFTKQGLSFLLALLEQLHGKVRCWSRVLWSLLLILLTWICREALIFKALNVEKHRLFFMESKLLD